MAQDLSYSLLSSNNSNSSNKSNPNYLDMARILSLPNLTMILTWEIIMTLAMIHGVGIRFHCSMSTNMTRRTRRLMKSINILINTWIRGDKKGGKPNSRKP